MAYNYRILELQGQQLPESIQLKYNIYLYLNVTCIIH